MVGARCQCSYDPFSQTQPEETYIDAKAEAIRIRAIAEAGRISKALDLGEMFLCEEKNHIFSFVGDNCAVELTLKHFSMFQINFTSMLIFP